MKPTATSQKTKCNALMQTFDAFDEPWRGGVVVRSMTTRLIVLAGALALGPVVADTLDLEGLQGLSRVHRHQLDVQTSAQRYYLLVREPEGYDPKASRRYPVVYLLDGGETFGALAGYTRYLRLGEEIPELFVVGVSYGTDDWRQGNGRSRDYTAPSAEAEHWGGAEAFLGLLERELLPFVESRYRVDPARRILFGQSLGGQFVLYAAQQQPALFSGMIASNPALHRNLALFLAPMPLAESGFRPGTEPAAEPALRAKPRLFVSSGSDDDPTYRVPTLRWMAHWQAVENAPWRLETRTLEGFGHFSALTEAYRQGLHWLLGPEPGDAG